MSNINFKKNIVVVCAWYEVGMRHYAINILKALQSDSFNNYNIKVLLVLRKESSCYVELKEFTRLDVETIVLKNPIVNFFSKFTPSLFDYYLIRFLKRNKADILYILFGGLFFKQLNRIKKVVPVLSTVHDMIPHEKNKQNIKEKVLSFLENKRDANLIMNANFLLTNSEKQYSLLKERGKSAFYCSMPSLVSPEIANGVELLPELFEVKDYILYFGRFDKYKGIDNLVNCHIESKTNTTLVLAGSGKLWFDIPASKKIIVINRFIKDVEMNRLFTNAMLCVIPYISATQTSLISIPFYFKCPTIYSNIDNFDLVRNATDSIAINFKLPKEYFIKIIDLHNNDERLRKIVELQTKYYEKNFGQDSLVKNIKEVFYEIFKI